MTFISALILGLIAGWLACKHIASGKPIKSVEDVRATASSAIDAAVEGTSSIGSKAARATEGLAGKAAGAAGTVDQKAANTANAVASKVSAGETGAPGDSSENQDTTIASLRDEVAELTKKLKEVEQTSRQ